VPGLARTEQRLEQRVGQDAGVEDFDEAMQGRGSPGVLENRLHAYIITLTRGRTASRHVGSRLAPVAQPIAELITRGRPELWK